jgi:hypothetical protein
MSEALVLENRPVIALFEFGKNDTHSKPALLVRIDCGWTKMTVMTKPATKDAEAEYAEINVKQIGEWKIRDEDQRALIENRVSELTGSGRQMMVTLTNVSLERAISSKTKKPVPVT